MPHKSSTVQFEGIHLDKIQGGVTYEMYQCRNSCSQIVWRGINVEQQVTKLNAEIQLKSSSLYLKHGIYFLQGVEYLQPIIETSVYLNVPFIRGNTMFRCIFSFCCSSASKTCPGTVPVI